MNPYLAIHYLQEYVTMLEREAKTSKYLNEFYLRKADDVRGFIAESAKAVEEERARVMGL
jgi:hypothetical protein